MPDNTISEGIRSWPSEDRPMEKLLKKYILSLKEKINFAQDVFYSFANKGRLE